MKKHANIEILNFKEGQEIVLYGWAATIRKMSGFNFVDLRDRSGIVQLVFNTKIDFSKESVLKVSGIVRKRKSPNHEIPTGLFEVEVNDYEVLSKAKDLPFEIKNDLNTKEDLRLQYRYLDLRRESMYNNLLLRHKVIKKARDWFDKNGFLEIETPILSKSTPEGARDYLVPTRNEQKFFALPQSPQIYKQLLMISGVERYFQVCRAFRDEDMRKDRQPEFTQLDIEMSFVNEEDLFTLMEQLYVDLMSVIDVKITTPFARLKYEDVMDQYGSDKPDLRYGYKLQDITFLNKKPNVIFENKESIKMLIFDQSLSNKDIKTLEEIALKNKAEKLIAIKINQKTFNSNALNDLISQELNQIIKDNNLNDATIFLVSGSYNQTTQALGAVRVKLNEMFALANDDEYKFAWIIDWPMFEKDDDGNLASAHHPFTSPTAETIQYLRTQPEKVRARSYDLVLNGYELSSGSIRIFDQELQTTMFQVLNLTDEQIKNKFGFFINAFNYGTPPHGGLAFGLDRLLMILSKSTSIREVIAFPKNANGLDVMLNSPSKPEKEQLEEYDLIFKENK